MTALEELAFNAEAMAEAFGVRNGPDDDLRFFVDGLADLVTRRQSGFII